MSREPGFQEWNDPRSDDGGPVLSSEPRTNAAGNWNRTGAETSHAPEGTKDQKEP